MSAPQDRLKVLLALLALSAAWALWPKKETPSAATPQTERGRSGRKAGVADWNALPSLDLPQKESAPDRVERNIFRFYDKPTPTPTRVPIPPTPVPESIFVNYPRPLTPTPTATPIVPPQIPFTAIGRFGPPERPIVVLETGGKLINAREGDVVEARFQIRKINRESIDIGFTELPHDITRRLPITGMDR